MPSLAVDCILAVDVGSSAVRAAVIDAHGTRLAENRTIRTDSMSGITFDADILWTQVTATINALPEGLKARVTGIGFAGHIGTVFVDAALRPVGPAFGWADAAGVDEFVQRLGADVSGVLEETGRPAPAGGGVAAALAMRTRAPADYRRVKYVLHPKDYLVARLTGEIATDFSSAAYYGASSVLDRKWSHRILSAVDLDPDLFPDQHSSTTVVGTLTARISSELGLPSGTDVVTGGPDGTVGATFVIRNRPDVIADVAGTTDVLVRLVRHPELSPSGAIINPYTLSTLWSAGGATGMTGGALTKWSQLLGLGTPADALKTLWPRMQAIGPGAEGLTVSPSLSGSRFPRWDASERGLIQGQGNHHGPEHFIRAVAEGAAYICREGIDILAGTTGSDLPVVLAGGAARSPELAQMRADILNRNVLVCEEPDVSLMGAGLLGALGTGLLPSITEAARFGADSRSVTPDQANAERYEDLYWRSRSDIAKEPEQLPPMCGSPLA